MSYPSAITRFGAILFSGLLVSAGYAQPRNTLNLDGVWNFATDPGNRGETDKWYQPDTKLPKMPLPGYAPTADGHIRVPGIWDNQGYGVENEKVRHNFVGKGWYKRQVEVPLSWSDRRTFLVITGVHRYSKVWIDNNFLGEHIGLLSTQEYDVTPYVAPGKKVTITIQVDSKQRWEVDTMTGSTPESDYMEIAWGGIQGHVFLEARSDAWLSDLYIQSDVPNSTCQASATLNGKTDLLDEAELDVFDRSGRRVAEVSIKLDSGIAPGQSVSIKTALPDAALWTPDKPTLYTAQLSLLKGGQVCDVVKSRFGMRQFTVDGPYILLNGKRIMLRGYGSGHIYPEQMSRPSDKTLHLRQLNTIKSYGFNHVRNHSTIMPPEYYEACDEVGIIATAEFHIGYDRFIPGTGDLWKTNVKPGTDPKPAFDTYHREWAAVITQHRNHPCILCWVMGNELYADIPIRYSFRDIAKKLDPSRLFLDSDGVDTALLTNPNLDRPTAAIYDIQFAEWSDPIMNVDKFKMPKPIKPVLSHEAGNYVTFSRPDLADQFQHNFKPFWMTAGKTKLAKLGLLQEAGDWAQKSERLYALLHKYNLEALRNNPYISGYHWWLFQDYWTTSDGIVDHYFRPKSITKEEVLKYNNDVVLLQKGLDRTYRSKKRLELKLLVSNFSNKPLEGQLVWEVKAENHSLAKRSIAISRVPQGELAEIFQIGLELPEVTSPCKLTITAELTAGGKRFANDWCSWLYPDVIKPGNISVPVFADDAKLKRFSTWDVKPIPLDGELPSRAVYLTGKVDARILDAIGRGASVVMFDGTGRCGVTNLGLECVSVVTFDGFSRVLRSYPVTFRTTWWRAGEKREENNTGTFVYDHPATRAMATDGWCDDGWFHLIDGGCKFDLETAPARPEVLIRALTSLMLPADEALLFEVGVGRGSLIVSGLNHRQAEGRPENEWIIARLLDYAATFPQPKAKWPASFLTVVSVAPEGCLPGFSRLVANEGEDGTWHSYREDNARVFLCRQTKPGNLVCWETAPVPKDLSGDQVTFAFAGGLGFSSEPKTEGFALEINGREVLRFDMPASGKWESADKRIELKFDVRRTISVDQIGLFSLKIPRDMLKAGEPCRLGVRSLGAGSRRWFGLNPYF